MPASSAVKTQADMIPKNAIAKIFFFMAVFPHISMIIPHFALVSSSNHASLNGKLRETYVLYAGGFYHVLGNLGAEQMIVLFF